MKCPKHDVYWKGHPDTNPGTCWVGDDDCPTPEHKGASLCNIFIFERHRSQNPDDDPFPSRPEPTPDPPKGTPLWTPWPFHKLRTGTQKATA